MNQTKPKILYIITQGEWGGAQRYVFDLATNLACNFDVSIAIGELKGNKALESKINPRSSRGQKSKIKIIELQHLVRKISPWDDILTVFELAKLYRTLKPDIIHLNSSKAGILGSFAGLLAKMDSRFRGNDKMKVIYTVHGWVFNEPNRKVGRWLYRWLEKLTSKWKDKIIVLSEQDLLAGRQLGIPEKKLIKIPLGIEIPFFLDTNTAREALSQISNFNPRSSRGQISNFLTGTIANLYPTKGIDVLIEAVKISNIKYQISNIKYIVIGEGPERKRLENLIKKYNLENTIFLIGTLDNAVQYLPAFDMFVLPSRKEGLPYTLLEAMAQGTPIIATNTGGVSSLIQDKENGLLVEPENAQQLSDALSWVIKNYEEMKKRALRASENVKPLTIKNMIDQTKSIYCPHLPEKL